jgi:hypothetical protein
LTRRAFSVVVALAVLSAVLAVRSIAGSGRPSDLIEEPASAVTGTPDVSVGDVSQFEGNSGTRLLYFPVTLSRPSTTQISVSYTTIGVSATGGKTSGTGIDFKSASGVVQFTPSNTTGLTTTQKWVGITVYGDTISEPNEVLTLSLSSSQAKVLRNGTGTILNDDVGSGLRVGVGDAAITEGDSGTRSLRVAITLTSAPGATVVSVPYTITGITATHGTSAANGDYGSATSGKLTFKTTSTKKSLTIKVFSESTAEANETFRVSLGAVTGATVARQNGTATILDDDSVDGAPPSVPSGLVATAVSSSAIDLVWSGSTDNVGVIGYRIYRDGGLVGSSVSSSFHDAGLSGATTYTYNVAAFDAAGNVSAQSSAASATTFASSSSGLLVGDDAWGLLINAGRWNGGNWRATIDSYLSARQAQGFSAVEVSAFSWLRPEDPPSPFKFTTGQDWDGLYPFNSSMNPSSGLNTTTASDGFTFWDRRDYLITQAGLRGITVVLNVTTPALNFSTNPVSPLQGWTSQQWTDYATALGNRYKNAADLMWILGDDYYGTLDAGFNSWLWALRLTGDQHPVSVQNMVNSTSQTQIQSGDPLAWGSAHAQFDWVYTYDVSYDGVEKAYSHGDDIPVYFGDGNGLGNTDLTIMRKMIWWALSSGARGFSTIDENLWKFPSNWHDLMTGNATPEATFWSTVIPAIASAFSGLTDWSSLLPDTNSQLVTSGRGTHAAGNTDFYGPDTDNYVTASRTPNGDLGVVYLSHARTITVDTSKLLAGYVARWMDPLTGAQYSATPTATNGAINTYNSGVAQGAKGINNSAGGPDWILVFRR